MRLASRPGKGPEELQAAAVLRALSFYAYPPERAFAGQVASNSTTAQAERILVVSTDTHIMPMQIHQQMQADAEFNALIEMTSEELRRQNHAKRTGRQQSIHSVCLIAVCHQLLGQELDDRLKIGSEAVLGTLDLYSAQAPPGQVLIGMSMHTAHSDVCQDVANQETSASLSCFGQTLACIPLQVFISIELLMPLTMQAIECRQQQAGCLSWQRLLL